jgi:alkanesulfonate monooxygenase SsuD/methylene tetrahydromethanopterin reductase-like flavin-dependent oxidoreductase (luciferase family)
MWTQEFTTFKGKYYNLSEMVQGGELQDGECPKIMVGGGGKQLLTVAGRHADIVGIQPREFFDSLSISLADVRKRIDWVKESARKSGRDLEEIEFQMEFTWAVINDDPEPIYERHAKIRGVSIDRVKAHSQGLIGSVNEIINRLSLICEETDISYIVFGPTNINDYELFATEVIPALS